MKYLLISSYNKEILNFLERLNPPEKEEVWEDIFIMGFLDIYDFNYEEICEAIALDFMVPFRGFLTPEISHENLEFFLREFKKSDRTFLKVSELVLKAKEPLKAKVLEKVPKEYEEIILGFLINDLNISKAAAYLGLHRNTLNLKINRLLNLTNLDLRKFYDSLAFYKILNEGKENG